MDVWFLDRYRKHRNNLTCNQLFKRLQLKNILVLQLIYHCNFFTMMRQFIWLISFLYSLPATGL